jgi:hypothetical protein
MLVLLMAAAKILAVKAGTFIHQACLPACLVSLFSLPSLLVPTTSTLVL